jgi:hypothetical protein
VKLPQPTFDGETTSARAIAQEKMAPKKFEAIFENV